MNIVVKAEARAEFDVAVDFYAQRAPDAARDFTGDFDKLTLQLLQFPHSGKRVAKNVRQVLFSRFPFKLIYRVEGDEIVIYAVAHQSRRPGYWRKRIGAKN